MHMHSRWRRNEPKKKKAQWLLYCLNLSSSSLLLCCVLISPSELEARFRNQPLSIASRTKDVKNGM
jgi:hypothetical protein